MTKLRRKLENLSSLDTENLSSSSLDQNHALENPDYFNTLFEHPFMDVDVYLDYFNNGFRNGEQPEQIDSSSFGSMHGSGPLAYPGVKAEDSLKVKQNLPLHQTSKVVTRATSLESNTEQNPYKAAEKKRFNLLSIHPNPNSPPRASSTPDLPSLVYCNILPKPIDPPTHSLTRNPFGSEHSSGIFSPDFKAQNAVMNPEQTYIGLVPLINKLNPKNFAQVLIAVSRICQSHVSLDEFYKLLLWDETRTQITEFPGLERVDSLEPSTYRNEGLKLCEFVLGTFRFPWIDVGDFAAGLVKNPKLSAISFDHARCTFLAIKIILDCTVEVRKPLKTAAVISLSSIRYAYYIIGRAILQKYGTISRSSQSLESMLLKKLHVGRLLNLIYKHLPRRRLGRRGFSEFHYFGLTWNTNIIDEEILSMIDAEEQNKEGILRIKEKYPPRETQETQEFEIDTLFKSFSHSNFQNCARYSFIRIDTKFQTPETVPREWKPVTDEFPAKSAWSTSVILKSTAVLKDFMIDFRSIIREFFSTINSCGNHNSEALGFFKAMETLQRQRVQENVYLHLFLAMLLSTHSLCLFVEEVNSSKSKIQEETTLKTFLKELKARQSSFVGNEKNHYLTFMALIEKIIQVVELSRVEVRTSSTKDIVEAFVRDIKRVTEPQFTNGVTCINEAIMMAVAHAINAYDGNHVGKGEMKESPELKLARIMKITAAFSESCKKFVERVGDIPKSMKEQDLLQSTHTLAFHILVMLVKEFHQLCLSHQEVMELPIQAILAILAKLSDMVIRVSFENFGKRESELSKQVFKTFWVWTFMLNEYVRVHFEIVALAGRIREDEDDG